MTTIYQKVGDQKASIVPAPDMSQPPPANQQVVVLEPGASAATSAPPASGEQNPDAKNSAEEEDTVDPKKKLNSKSRRAWPRRIVRMGLLVIILFLVIGVTYLVYHFALHTEKWVTLSSSVTIKLKAQNCLIFIGDSSTVSAGTVSFYGDVPGSGLTVNSNGEITETNSIDAYPNSCVMELLYRAGEVLSGGITLDCKGTCNFCHRGTKNVALNLGAADLVIGGEGRVNVMIQKLIANRANIQVQRGDVHIYSATLMQDSTLTSNEGDVAVQSTNGFRTVWTQNDRNLCLYAPKIGYEGSSVLDCSLQYNGVSADCKPVYTMCKDSSASCSGSGLITLTLGAQSGNVYANVISEDYAYVLDSYNSVVGANYSNGINFDSRVNGTFPTIALNLNDTNKPDPYLHFHIGNTEAFSTRGITMLTASNPGYLDLHPWWISFLSLSLLMGKVISVDGRLAPGFCPFRVMPTTQELSAIKTFITSMSSPYVVNNRFALSFIYGSHFQTVTDSPQAGTGFLGLSDDFDLYSIEIDDPKNPTLKKNNISNQYQLVVAVVISVILAAMIGVVLIVALLYGLDQFTHHYTSQSSHMIRYCEVFARKDLTEEEKLEKLNALTDTTEAQEVKESKGKKAGKKHKKNKKTAAQKGPPADMSRSVYLQEVEASALLDAASKESKEAKEEPPSEEEEAKRNPKVADGRERAGGRKPESDNGRISVCGCWVLDAFIDIVANLPSQFMFVDMLIREVQVWIFSSSSQNFYRLLFKKVPCDMKQRVDEPFVKIKLEYEKYCFLKQLSEENLISLQNRKYLERMGFLVEERCDSTTEVLKKFRGLTDKERLENNFEESGIELDQGISSLELFMKMNYKESEFETDSILFSDFMEKYHDFCEKHRLKVLVVTKPLLQNTYGINTARKTSTYLIRKGQLEDSSTTYYDLSYKSVKDEIKSMLDEGTVNKDITRLRREMTLGPASSTVDPAVLAANARRRRNEDKDALVHLWPVFDFAAVLVHLLIVLLMVLAPIILPMFIQLSYTRFSLAEPREMIRWEDFKYTPWTILYKFPYYSMFSKVCCIIAIIYAAISMVDLMVYYGYISFPVETMRNYHAHRERDFILDLVLQKIAWIYIFIVLFLASMYFGLVIIWFILGAVLNPNAYLVYATAAGTFLTFVTTKVKELSKAYRKGKSTIIKLLDAKLRPYLNDIMRKILTKAGYDSAVNKPTKESRQSSLEKAKVNFIGTTPLGRKIARAQLETRNVIGMVEGKQKEIENYAQEQTIPLLIVSALVAMAKEDSHDLARQLITISSRPPFHIPAAVINMIEDILNCQSKESIPNIVTMLAREFVAMLRSKYAVKQFSPVTELGLQIFPQAVLAMYELSMQDVQKFVDTFDKINRFVVDSVSKQRKHEDFLGIAPGVGEEAKGNSERLPALPLNLIQALEVLKVVCDKSKIGRNTKKRFVNALCCLMNSVVGVNRSLLDFLILFINKSSHVVAARPLAGAVFREQQHRILQKVATGLGVAPTALQLIWGAIRGDFYFDEHFVNQCAKWLSKSSDVAHPVEYLDMMFTVINLLSLRRADLSAEKFALDKECEAFFGCIGLNPVNPRYYRSFMRSKVANILSAKLRIEPDCVLGLICLIKGDIDSPYMDEVLEPFCKRNKVTEDFIPYIKALLTILTSKDPDVLADALSTFGAPHEELVTWLLMGRRVLHPRHVPEKEFRLLELPVGKSVIKDRDALLMLPDSPVTWNMWLNDMRVLLETVETQVAGSGAVSAREKPVPLGSSENSATGEEAKEREKDKEGKEDKEKKEVPRYLRGEKADKKPESMTTDELLSRRDIACTLLCIEQLQMNVSDIKKLLGRTSLNLMHEASLDNISRLLSVQNISNRKDKILVNLAAHNLAVVLNLDVNAVIALTDVLLAADETDMRTGLTTLFDGEQSLVEFGMQSFDRAQLRLSVARGLDSMSNTFGIPPALPVLLLTTDPAAEPYQPTFQDLADVFDIFTRKVIVDAERDSKKCLPRLCLSKDASKRRSMDFRAFKYNLCGLASGQLEPLTRVLEKAGVPEHVQDVVQLMVKSKQTPFMMRDKLAPLCQKLGVPLSVYHNILTIVLCHANNP